MGAAKMYRAAALTQASVAETLPLVDHAVGDESIFRRLLQDVQYTSYGQVLIAGVYALHLIVGASLRRFFTSSLQLHQACYALAVSPFSSTAAPSAISAHTTLLRTGTSASAQAAGSGLKLLSKSEWIK